MTYLTWGSGCTANKNTYRHWLWMIKRYSYLNRVLVQNNIVVLFQSHLPGFKLSTTFWNMATEMLQETCSSGDSAISCRVTVSLTQTLNLRVYVRVSFWTKHPCRECNRYGSTQLQTLMLLVIKLRSFSREGFSDTQCEACTAAYRGCEAIIGRCLPQFLKVNEAVTQCTAVY